MSWVRSRVAALCGALGLLSASACQSGAAPEAQAPESPQVCQSNQTELLRLLEMLPEKGLAVRGRSDLPVAALGGVIGGGRVVDISDSAILLDGTALPGDDGPARIAALEQSLGQATSPGVGHTLLYLAVAAETEVPTLRSYLRAIPRGFDVHLVFQSPTASAQPRPTSKTAPTAQSTSQDSS